MIHKRPISAYTPSNTDPETRARIFVQRHQLLRRAVRWCEESMLTGDKHHLLFIGPRGCGKTHLVAMVHDRLSQNPQLGDKMRVAWLGEDSVFTGLIDFALEIADELSREYPDEFHADYRDEARPLSADEAAEMILHEVIGRLGDKNILLIMENLDRAFHGLGDSGQKKWRAFLQENGRVATLATSQQLFDGVSSRDAAFYGFFEIVHLEPLSVDDARALMAKIAREIGKQDVAQFLATAEGRYRVRALHHLAGGNHRMYVMLSEFLTKESLDGLVAAFEQLAEDLTPYFQERVGSLPPQQARIVQSLCNSTGAMTVKAISEDTFISDRNVSRQLGDLRQKGYVVSAKRGKESFYEMAEPLMRLCLEVKKQRGKPLKLVVAFLRAWYSAKSLRAGELGASTSSPRGLAYKETALRSDDSFRQAINRELSSEFASKLEGEHFDDAMDIAEEIVYADRPSGLLHKSRVLRERGRLDEALAEIDSVLSLPGVAAEEKSDALFNRGVTYGQLGESEKAIADYSAVIEMEDAPVGARARAMVARGVGYAELGEWEKVIPDCSAVIEMEGVRVDLRAWMLSLRGSIYGARGESEKAIADYSAVIEMEDVPVDARAKALAARGDSYGTRGESEKAIADYSAAIEMEDAPVGARAQALVDRGLNFGELGESEKAIADYSAVIEMEDAPVDARAQALVDRGLNFGELGQSEKAIADFSAVIEMEDGPVRARAKALLGRCVRCGRRDEWEKVIADCCAVIEMEDVPVSSRAWALGLRGSIYGARGESEKAIADFSAAIEMEDAPVGVRAQALVDRGLNFGELGESEKAIADFSAAIEMEDAPVDARAKALVDRGARYWHLQRFESSLSDFTAAAEMTGVLSSTRTQALFCIPEAMIPLKSVSESVESIRHAFSEGDPETDTYGGTPRDILRMVMGREPHSWAGFVEALVPIYAQNGALSTLSSGLTESIAALDSGGYSDSQLDLWNSSWQRCGAEHDELSIALSALNAAVEVIKTRDDRPLFALPSEIREIVRPLLKHSLSSE